MKDLWALTGFEISELFQKKEISAVELLQMYLQRVDTHNPMLNAICVDIRYQAMKDAEVADTALAKGQSLGAFHGVPMTVKESYNVAGTPTTWGNPDWRNNVTQEDAECVKKLKSAGVNVFGKTNVVAQTVKVQGGLRTLSRAQELSARDRMQAITTQDMLGGAEAAVKQAFSEMPAFEKIIPALLEHGLGQGEGVKQVFLFFMKVAVVATRQPM